ncbi:MAG: DUF839 domain-containing protein, partial [Pseudomonadales bacterium]|nr:DUF839 domain-containing protein [Pseudomonadales bacterium]
PGSDTGPFGFTPIEKSAVGNGSDFDPAAPWLIPEGFVQYIVSDESDLDIYTEPTTGPNSNDWHDMNTVNETGKHAGRFLYRTHEVRGNEERGGAVSVVDLDTGISTVIAEDPTYDALDGIEWTPWGTVLFAEETTGGRLFEMVVDQHDPTVALDVIERPAVGSLAHEGVQVGVDSSVYVVDEFRGEREGYGGGVYRFVPDSYGDLSSGQLFVLKVTGGANGTGQGEWVGPINPAFARVDGTVAGGTGYNRPEDLEIIGDTLYVAVTEGPTNGGTTGEIFDGRVLAVNLNSLVVTDYVRPGLNVPVEAGGATGFDNPDNLAQTPDGKLIIVEDNNPSDIWIASPDLDGDGAADEVSLFASLTDNAAEGTGIYFGKDPKTLFVNVQHSKVDDGDATWAITKINKKVK